MALILCFLTVLPDEIGLRFEIGLQFEIGLKFEIGLQFEIGRKFEIGLQLEIGLKFANSLFDKFRQTSVYVYKLILSQYLL